MDLEFDETNPPYCQWSTTKLYIVGSNIPYPKVVGILNLNSIGQLKYSIFSTSLQTVVLNLNTFQFIRLSFRKLMPPIMINYYADQYDYLNMSPDKQFITSSA
eukprot:GHVR01102202.1.p1 GENE.GHVR01102202.1~~GHVR01102202.1.p1  ORF type:complete len:103 (+),score=3.83 GHVR01102202.1:600-908(+)